MSVAVPPALLRQAYTTSLYWMTPKTDAAARHGTNVGSVDVGGGVVVLRRELRCSRTVADLRSGRRRHRDGGNLQVLGVLVLPDLLGQYEIAGREGGDYRRRSRRLPGQRIAHHRTSGDGGVQDVIQGVRWRRASVIAFVAARARVTAKQVDLVVLGVAHEPRLDVQWRRDDIEAAVKTERVELRWQERRDLLDHASGSPSCTLGNWSIISGP